MKAWNNRSVGERTAIIAGISTIIVALIYVKFGGKSVGDTATTSNKSVVVGKSTGTTVAAVSPEIKGSSNQVFSGNSAPTIIIQGQAGAITFNTGSVDSETSKAIHALENRATDADCKIELTHGEVELLANALKELDARTSGMIKLPDGRTKYSLAIGGNATLLYQAEDAATVLYNSTNFPEAFVKIESAIEMYEKTQELAKDAIFRSDPDKSAVSSLYRIAAVICLALTPDKAQSAYDYAKKAVDAEDIGQNKVILAISSYNFGKYDEATNLMASALEKYRQTPQIDMVKHVNDIIVNRLSKRIIFFSPIMDSKN